ncbi:MAG: sugar transferase [Lachnospiraceae bacterium]|nr:sugar transferase [Lachnospiraceae bacterium]
MFQKENLIKRYIFLFLDMLIVALSLGIANIIRFGKLNISEADKDLYLLFLLVELFACVLGNRLFNLDSNIFDRGWFKEFFAVLKSEICIMLAGLFFLYFIKESTTFPRLQMLYFLISYFVLSYLGHQLVKKLIAVYYKNSHSFKQIMLISTSDKVEQIVEKIKTTNNWYFKIAYITLVDRDAKGEEIGGIPVIANVDDMLEESKTRALDGVFINLGYANHGNLKIIDIMHEYQSMGVFVHVNIDALELDVANKKIENLGFFKVVTYSSKLRDPAQMALKRIMDILGGFIGSLFTLILCIFLIPAICIESPGAPIYTSTRVGRNGRHFKMYKFRSMYKDAEARKAELMAQNEMQGAMFKMENDPRITKVGKFIRKTSLDEFPQFFNVLKGDMSLVGTRPPTVDEVEQYQVEQKRRLSVTPGITGLWQATGRSDIVNFEDVVKLDLEYIDNWSIGLDIKLLFMTIGNVFLRKGAK